MDSFEIIVVKAEAYLKKIIFLKDGNDISVIGKNFLLKEAIKRLDLSNKIKNNTFKKLDETDLAQIKENEPDYLYHICRSNMIRNKSAHLAANPNKAEMYNRLQNIIITCLYTTLKYYIQLKPLVASISDDENLYNNHIINVLSNNPTQRLIQSEFGHKFESFDDFEIKIRTRQNTNVSVKEREVYVKESAKNNALLNEILPDFDKIISTNKYYLLHGIATSGKSTILKSIGRKFINKFKEEKDRITFFIELGKFYNNNNGTSIIDEIKRQYEEIIKLPFNLSVFKKVLILLDGFDEVANIEKKNTMLLEIEALKLQLNIQIILTSRTNDYVNNNHIIEKHFHKHELLPLNINEMVQIAKKVLIHDELTGFVKLIKNSEIVKAFPKTPITTLFLAILFKDKQIDVKELPKNITELYRKIIDLFLNKWDTNKGISQQFKLSQHELILQKIAIHLHNNRYLSIKASELENFVSNLLSEKSLDENENSCMFLEKICERTNIFFKNEEDNSYQFIHLTIQEYLASTKFNHKNYDNLIEKFYDEWWLNPNIFFAGRDPENFDILEKISKFHIYPNDLDTKLNYVIHTSKVLLASHSLDRKHRNSVLRSMIKIFDEFIKEIIDSTVSIKEFTDKREQKFANRTLLDIILMARVLFVEFFSSNDFKKELESIWKEYIEEQGLFIKKVFG